MRCEACGHENREGAGFCGGCGQSLARERSCASCGSPNPHGQRFCDACGRPIEDPSSSGGPAPAPEIPLPGPFVEGRYTVSSFLGEGARKRVYLAHDSRLARDVAFALIKTEGLDEIGLERIHREAQSMARLGDHANTVTVFDIGDEQGQPYIVSQYMAGGDLTARLGDAPNRRLPLDEALSIAEQIGRALEHAHAHDVIHRDLKPGNVWLAADGTAKLGDFGLAIATDRSRITQEGMMLGTVAYMSPEQAMARPLDPRSGLYSFGAVLYEMVAGRPPFTADDAVGVVSQHINTAPVAPSWHNEEVPRSVETLVLRLLEKDPGARPASARAVVEEIERIRASTLEREVDRPEQSRPSDLAGVNWGRFFGRHEEMDQLKTALDEALSGRGSLRMLVGEPGIGKTRLAEEFAVHAGMRGAQVLSGACYEGESSIPYLPFVEAFRQYARGREDEPLRAELGDGAPEVATLVSEIRQRFPDLPHPPPLEGEAERMRLFSSATEFIANASRATPIVLFFDDIHWADKPSLLLLQYLARHVGRERILVVAAYRDVELDRTHPLAEVLADLRRERTYQRILLRGLGRDDIVSMLTAAAEAAGGEANVDGRTALAEALYNETEGNPFFVREVLTHLLEEGKLYRGDDGRWTSDATTVEDLGIPEGVREVVGRRLSRLSESCNDMLTLASTMTSGFSWEALLAVSALGEATLLEALEEALAAQLVRERGAERGGSYEFTHALIRQTLYEELSTPRRVLLHRQIGEALEGVYGESVEAHLPELAHHFFQAAPGGDVDKAIDYATRAGNRDVELLGYEEAAGHYDRALQALDLSGAGDPARCYELHLALGNALTRADLNDRALSTLHEAVELGAGLDAERLARAALELAEATSRGARFGMREQIPALDRALAALPEGDGALRARLMARHAEALMVQVTSEERPAAIAEAEGACEMAERVGDGEAQVAALFALHQLLSGPDHTERRIEIGLDRLRLTEQLDRPTERAWAGITRLGDLMELGDVATFEREMGGVADLTDSLREPSFSAWRIAWTGMLAGMRGQWEVSEAQALALVPIVERTGGDVRWRGTLTALLYDARRGTGQLEGLEQGILDTYADEGILSRSMKAAFEAALSLVFLETDREEQAREWYEKLAVADFAELPPDFNLMVTLTLATVLATRLGDVRRAQILYDRLRPYAKRHIIVGPAVLMLGSANYPLGILSTALERWDDAECHFEDAIEQNGAIGATPWLARSRHEYAVMLQRRGRPEDRERLQALLNEAVADFDELGMRYEMTRALALRLELQGVGQASPMASIDVVASHVGGRRPDLSSEAAPDGTVTLMFSDMEGFTPMTERLGDLRARDVVRDHNRIVRDQFAAHSGYEVELQGDGFLVAFSSARRALLCATSIQRAFAAYNAEHGDEPIRVRIGLHTGEALKDADKFFGRTVILASRIAGEAQGGEILVSSLLRELTVSTGDLRFGEGREIRLKGIAEPQSLYPVVWT